ncbi:MAG: TfoX/Sxy family protein [Clostridia bacterium]|nr:TfoX/Sxy family protein [Clostridia bacterium]
MATSKDFINYLAEKLHGTDVTFRPMMGEYLVYYNGKLVGDVCDNRLLIKPVEAAKEMLPSAQFQLPYEGASKPMILVEEIDDGEFLKALFDAMYPQLPMPKPKKAGKSK